jgi:hypothetical protein
MWKMIKTVARSIGSGDINSGWEMGIEEQEPDQPGGLARPAS